MRRKNQLKNITNITINNFFHEIGKRRIFCTLISPLVFSEKCIIYFSPIFEERMWCHQTAFNFARELAGSHGYNVLMFDYFGYGESDGNPEDFSMENCRIDIKELLTLMKKKGVSRFILWGIRTGCAIALMAMKGCERVTSALLWAPVMDLQKYLFESLRSTMTAQFWLFKKSIVKRETILEELINNGQCKRDGYVLNYVEGYRFGKSFYLETLNLDHDFNLNQIPFPILIIETILNNINNIKPMKLEDKKEYNENPNITYYQIPERKFWLINDYYSQRTDTIYQVSQEWLYEWANITKR